MNAVKATEKALEAPLDEHVDDFCFTLALALRRMLGLTADSTPEEAEADAEFAALLEELPHE